MPTITTWNCNSVRLRLPGVKQIAETQNPDILCLQETKVEDAKFPVDALRSMGYEHIYFSGEKSYNGVAILSKLPLTNIFSQEFVGINHKRHIAAQLPDGTTIHNFYIPAGGDEPDPETNPKFDHKLKFCEEIASWLPKQHKENDKVVILGDFNIAPLENDVWSHKQLLKIVSHTPPETERLAKVKSSLNWVDCLREFTPPEEKLYSWWSYRNRDWRKSNRGRRLDHIWVTQPLKTALKHGYIDTDARDWEKPSDHVPVTITLAS